MLDDILVFDDRFVFRHSLLSLITGYLVSLLITVLVFIMTKNSAESQVAERRLRPIYDWLDNGNNKKALQEADKVLKKQPNFQCCKVLKCLALIRLGKELDAEIILNKVKVERSVRLRFSSIDFMFRFWKKFLLMKELSKP